MLFVFVINRFIYSFCVIFICFAKIIFNITPRAYTQNGLNLFTVSIDATGPLTRLPLRSPSDPTNSCGIARTALRFVEQVKLYICIYMTDR